jgi:alanine dehydrogenase
VFSSSAAFATGSAIDFAAVPLYLSEEDVEALVDIDDALVAVEDSFRRLAAGVVENRPRDRLRLDNGLLAVMAASDLGLGVAGIKIYAAGRAGARFLVVLFDAVGHDAIAVIEADQLGRLRTGAASGVAAKYLAREDASTLGVIGCGSQAETQIAAIRAAVPTIEHVVVYCRTAVKREAFARRVGAESGETYQDAAAQEVVVTITTSPDPVLRGEWLSTGTLVCAAGANRPQARELDNAVLERAAFVCCDSREDARIESGDLIEPVDQGILDWLEVHELAEVVVGEVLGRQSAEDIVVFKSNGIAAWDVAIGVAAVARARERGFGREL